jgi:tetratricopeptide (TPR) repeat protein
MHPPPSLALALGLVAACVAVTARAEAPAPGSRAVTSKDASPGFVLATTIATRVPASPATVPPPETLLDLPAWLDYRARNHLAALPLEARLFYRSGLMLARSGDHEKAVRLVRGASELDPGFVAPHLTLASWFLPREPSQALLQYASVIELARQNFLLQLALVGNGLYLGFQSLFCGLLAAGLIVIGLRNRELRHAWIERLDHFVGPRTARRWSWAILLLPFTCGVGLALPAVVLLALLWPALKAGERAVFLGLVVMIAFTPWASGSLDRLAIPLREGQPPFYGVPLVGAEFPSDGQAQETAALARRRPENPFLQFAAAWTARRRGDLPAAEAGYRRALELWPSSGQVMTNLGNVLAMGGRTDEALELYRRAGAVDPSAAAAAFNASQIYTQRFDYHAATDALSRAAALNFDLVKTYQSQAGNDGVLPLVDEWIAPRFFWTALSRQHAEAPGRGALPPAWRSCIECSGWGFSVLALLAVAVALIAGARTHRKVPLRACSNCGAILCRRCACRRRETALCSGCAAAEARAETPDFGRVLLLQHRRRVRRSQRLLRTALATVIPGFGLLAFRRVVAAVLLLSASAALVALGAGFAAPFSYEARLAAPGQEAPLVVLVGLWAALYAVSLQGYVVQILRADAEEAAQAAPVRSRIRLSDGDRAAIAA